jgi:serine/threonine protein kinase
MSQSSRKLPLSFVDGVAGLSIDERLRERITPTQVFKGDSDETDYVVKIFAHREEDIPESPLRQLRREAAYYSAFDSEFIPSCFDVGLHYGHPYIVLEYIPGEPLDRIIEQKETLPPEEAREFALDLAKALRTFQQWGFLHRDVNPANIVIAENRLLLVDLELATDITPGDTRLAEDEVMGTPGYTAPEQTPLLNEPLTPSSDLYSLGAVLFEVIAGVPPFKGKDTKDILAYQAQQEPPDIRDYAAETSEVMARILDKLLRFEPSDRYESAQQLANDLSQIQPMQEMLERGDSICVGEASTKSEWKPKTPLVGRDESLEQLWNSWTAARRDQSLHLVLVEGPPGTGKTRLIEELGKNISRRTGKALRITSNASDTQPYSGLKKAMKRALSGEVNEGNEQLLEVFGPHRGVIKTMLPRLSSIVEDLEDESESTQHSYDEALSEFLTSLARMWDGLMLWFDDVQWIDKDSLRLIECLVENHRDAPIELVCTSRNDPPSKPTLEQFKCSFSERIDLHIRLWELEKADLEKMVAREFSQELVLDQPDFIEQLHRNSRGNPLFVWHFFRAIRDKGLIVPSWNSLQLDSDGLNETGLTSDLLSFMNTRLEEVSLETRKVLEVAAVLGDPFDLGLLDSVLDRLELQLDLSSALTEGRSRIVVQRAREAEHYEFHHERIRESLLENFDSERRKRHIHQAAAKSLDTGSENLDSNQIYARADFYLRGYPNQNCSATISASIEAARTALNSFANEKAYNILDRAAEQIDSAYNRKEFLALKAKAAHETVRMDEAESLYDSLLPKTERAVKRAKIERKLIQIHYYRYDFDEAEDNIFSACRAVGVTLPTERYSSNLLVVLSLAWNAIIGNLEFLFCRPDGGNSTESKTEEGYSLVPELMLLNFVPTYVAGNHLQAFQALVIGYRYGMKSGRNIAAAMGLCHYQMVRMSLSGQRPPDRHLEQIEDYLEQSQQSGSYAHAFARVGLPLFTELIHGDFQRATNAYERHREQIEYFTSVNRHYCHITYVYFQTARGYTESAAEVCSNVLQRYQKNDIETDVVMQALYFARLLQARSMEGQFEASGDILERLEDLESLLPDSVPHRRVHQLIGSRLTHYRQTGSLGENFDKVAETFDLVPEESQGGDKIYFVSLAYGRADQILCDPEGNSKDLDMLEDAVNSLETASQNPTESPAVTAHALVARGCYQHLSNRLDRAKVTLRDARQKADKHDNPWSKFEAHRQLAFLHETEKNLEKTVHHVEEAKRIALEHGWSHWPERLDAELALNRDAQQPDEGADEDEPVEELLN